jgi:hypothetical protein
MSYVIPEDVRAVVHDVCVQEVVLLKQKHHTVRCKIINEVEVPFYFDV